MKNMITFLAPTNCLEATLMKHCEKVLKIGHIQLRIKPGDWELPYPLDLAKQLISVAVAYGVKLTRTERGGVRITNASSEHFNDVGLEVVTSAIDTLPITEVYRLPIHEP